MKATILLLKRNAAVRIWFYASMQSWVGNGIAWPALVILAQARWHSAWGISLVLAADELPSAVLSALTGSLADRMDRRRLMMTGTALSALAYLVMFLSHSYTLLLVGAALAGVGSSIFSPASKAVLGQLGTKEDIPILSAMRALCFSVGFTLGPALAGLALLVTSAHWLLAADGLTFVVECILLSRLPMLKPRRQGVESFSKVGGIRAGIKIARLYPVAWAIIFAGAIGEIFAPLLNVALVPFAKHLLHHGNSSVGLLAAVTGLGLVSMAGALARKWNLSQLRLIYLAAWLIYGLSLPVMALAPYIGIALVMKYLQGAGNSAQISAQGSLINGTVPEHHTGQVFGLMDSVVAISFSISFLAAGSLLSVVGVAAGLSVAGGGCVVAALIASQKMGFGPIVGVSKFEVETSLEYQSVTPNAVI